MKSNSSLIYSLALAIGDFLALVAAFVGAYILRVSLDHSPLATQIHSKTYLGIFLSLLPFWLLIFALLGLYNSSIYEKRFSEAGRLLVGSFIGLLFVIGYAYFDNRSIFPARLVPVYGFVLAFSFLVIFRNLLRWLRGLLFRYNIGITNLLLIGNTEISQELRESLDNISTGYRIVGVVNGKTHNARVPYYSSFAVAVSKLKSADIHGIVQTELFADTAKNNEILEFAQANHISYRFIPGNVDLFVGKIDVELFRAVMPVIAVHQTPLIGWGRIVKRITDVVLGSLALVIASPLMLLIAIAIKLSDIRAPILFRDRRLTRFGGTTVVFKFRSHKRQVTDMTPEEAFIKIGRPELIRKYREGGDQLANDPRITKVGAFLRRTSLDELPQLINVVKGNISLVGPRALQGHELEKYDKKDLLLSVKSGLTGLAVVSGRRNISFEERRKLDLYYVQNWSLWLDLTILAKTIRAVFSRSGAI